MIGKLPKTLPRGFSVASKKSGTQSFIYRYSLDGKRYELNLGSVKYVPVQIALKKYEQARALVLDGKDPRETKKAKKQAVLDANKPSDKPLTFGEYYSHAIQTIQSVKLWKNKKHISQWFNTIETYALPVIGDMPLNEISRPEILSILKPIWTTKVETAYKVRGRLESIFSLAIMEGKYHQLNPATWKGNLEMLLPSPFKIRQKNHFVAMDYKLLPEFIQSLWDNFTVARALIIFTTLAACRIGESAPAKWSEIDLKNKVWNCPSERRKDGRPYPHRVPLSTKMIELLEKLEPKQKGFIFPGHGSDYVSKETPRVLIQRFSKSHATMHGMRSCFRDWAAENGISDILAEKSLMHTTGNEVVQAYQRSDLLDQRRPVMQKWSDYLLK